MFVVLKFSICSEPCYSYVGGMNGSIIHELDRPENRGLKKSVKVILHFIGPQCFMNLLPKLISGCIVF